MPMPDQQIGTQGLQSAPEAGSGTQNDEVTWEFERVSPAPGQSVPATSDEFLVVRVRARFATHVALDADEIAQIGVEIAFHKGGAGNPIAAWHALEIDTRRNENNDSGDGWVYFRLRVGPVVAEGIVNLAAGYWLTTMRCASPPLVARKLGLLTVSLPNP